MFSSILRHKSKCFLNLYQNFKLLKLKHSNSSSLIIKMATPVSEDFADFEAKFSLTNPMPDYLKLMEAKMKADAFVPSDIYDECWRKISAAAHETIWKMLFTDKEPPKKEVLDKVVEFMKTHKEDACFYQPSIYNKWIVKVRDELLKRKMFEFWKNEIVKNELGPCWARDSDLFDDTEDPEPAKFYKFADCEAPWLKKKSESEELFPKRKTPLKTIALETALNDYKYNIEANGEIEQDDDLEEGYNLIFSEVRDVLWNILFAASPLSGENSKKAGELLQEYKRDAVFHDPCSYNDWISKLRDEVLKHKYFEFWQFMVDHELGLCWARDSDFFDNMEDPEPVNFYKFNNCEAAWLKKKVEVKTPVNAPTYLLPPSSTDTPMTTKTLKKISLETPLEDFKYNMDTQSDIDGDDEEAYKKIFTEVRDIIWQLLFAQTPLTEVNSKKAASLLEAYKRDAGFFSPYAYNEWIPTVRDELFKRKYFDFWQNVIVDHELGLCWARDSDYFDDMEDPKPKEFYKAGEELMKQHKK